MALRIRRTAGRRLDARAIDTYGTVLACAELAVGERRADRCRLPVDFQLPGVIDQDALIDLIAQATAEERVAQLPKWQEVVEKILGASIDMYVGGRKPSVGETIADLEGGVEIDIREARARLAMMGLACARQGAAWKGLLPRRAHQRGQAGAHFPWQRAEHGGWTLALRQAPESVTLRNLEARYGLIDIARASRRCVLVDLAGYDEWTWTGRGGGVKRKPPRGYCDDWACPDKWRCAHHFCRSKAYWSMRAAAHLLARLSQQMGLLRLHAGSPRCHG